MQNFFRIFFKYRLTPWAAYDWLLRCGYDDAIPSEDLAARDLDQSGTTPHRTIRIPDDLWSATQAKARAEGADASEIIRRLLRAYITE